MNQNLRKNYLSQVEYGFRNKLFATLIPCGTASRHRLRLGMTSCCNESGRTMLEMLGVLAIMGIITYGAIAGINYGMSSYKVNQCYNEIQDIIRGIEDLYSWSKNYPSGTAMMQAACKNDVFAQPCTSDNTEVKGAFGEIQIMPIDDDGLVQTSSGSNFQVQISLSDDGECARLTSMDWDAANIKCFNQTSNARDCAPAPSGSILLNFSPK